MMNINILDMESAYRRMLAAPDDETRAAIFQREIAEPFSRLSAMYGGDAAFKQWGMGPEQYAGGENAPMAANVEKLAAVNAWDQAARAVEDARAAFARHVDLSVVGEIVFGLVLAADPGFGGGYSGFGAIPGSVMVTFMSPTEENLRAVQAATAHEMHHQFTGWLYGQGYIIQDVAHYMVNEGLAESFGAELYGADKVGPWVTAFDMSRLDETKARFRDAFGVSGFNEVRQYIFGDIMTRFSGAPSSGIPAYAGYALGYHTVQAYLKRTGKSVVEASLVPPHQLIAESGSFD